jgi:hypothetical protein
MAVWEATRRRYGVNPGARVLALHLHCCRLTSENTGKPQILGDAMSNQAREKIVGFVGFGMMGSRW